MLKISFDALYPLVVYRLFNLDRLFSLLRSSARSIIGVLLHPLCVDPLANRYEPREHFVRKQPSAARRSRPFHTFYARPRFEWLTSYGGVKSCILLFGFRRSHRVVNTERVPRSAVQAAVSLLWPPEIFIRKPHRRRRLGNCVVTVGSAARQSQYIIRLNRLYDDIIKAG